jgi:hypothetical protein
MILVTFYRMNNNIQRAFRRGVLIEERLGGAHWSNERFGEGRTGKIRWNGYINACFNVVFTVGKALGAATCFSCKCDALIIVFKYKCLC